MMMNEMAKKAVFFVALLGICIFHVGVNYQVLVKSHPCYIYDEYIRVASGYDAFQKIFVAPGVGLYERMKTFLQCDNGQGHPHFFEVIEGFSWKILAGSERLDPGLVTLFANTFFLVILLLSIYGTGSILYNRETGLLAALVTSMLPMVFGLSRVAMLDYPLMCMCSLSGYLLLSTDNFSSNKFSVLFGMAFGLTELTKEAAVVFIAPLVIYYFFSSLTIRETKKVVVNFMMAILVFLITTGIVYFRPENFHVYGQYISKLNIRNSTSLFYYIDAFHDFVGPWVFILSIPFFLCYWIKFKQRDLMLLFWFFLPFVLFSLSVNKATRFILPLAPVWALIIARGVLVNDWPKLVRRLCVVLFVLVLVVQYGAYNLKYLLPPEGYVLEKGRLSVEKDPYAPAVTGLVDVFKKEMVPSGVSRMVIPLFDNGCINDSLGLDFALMKLSFWMMCPIELDEVDARSSLWKGLPEEILMGDYVLERSEDHAMNPGSEINAIGRGLMAGFVKYRDHFVKIAEVRVYDNSRVDVYKRIKE